MTALVATTSASAPDACGFGYYSSLSSLVATYAPARSWCNARYHQQPYTTEITVTKAATVTIEVTPTPGAPEASVLTVTETETEFATPTTITRKEFPTLSETITSVVTTTSIKSEAAEIVTSTATVCPATTSTGVLKRWVYKHGGKKPPSKPSRETDQRQPSYDNNHGYLGGFGTYHGGSVVVINPSESATLDPTLCSCIIGVTKTVTTTSTGAAFTTTLTATLRPMDPAVSTTTATTRTTIRRVVITTLVSTVTLRTTTTNTISTTVTTTVPIATVTSSEFTMEAPSGGGCGCPFAVQCQMALLSFDLDGIRPATNYAECIDICNHIQECVAAEFFNGGSCITYYESSFLIDDPDRVLAVKQVDGSCNQFSDTCIYDGP
ncbi:hypothetical protein PFICI_10823 [Pestalotiopsis fici W106-1]|uniref:Uncharacterized protein n=2 Tax=Pestalotiopsis fici TaxID=393283 RepID=W3WT02_PESFW|nr:uncharacterized protein PFICI_10823 [Pestalotiopsis fici W106-1]AGO59051.1 hypothetical protein [Pestalotiopsis fici]ETS76949.1 hypothetical protein PFICI_10823 [Pestalotiopsis fici W106-1]